MGDQSGLRWVILSMTGRLENDRNSLILLIRSSGWATGDRNLKISQFSFQTGSIPLKDFVTEIVAALFSPEQHLLYVWLQLL